MECPPVHYWHPFLVKKLCSKRSAGLEAGTETCHGRDARAAGMAKMGMAQSTCHGRPARAGAWPRWPWHVKPELVKLVREPKAPTRLPDGAQASGGQSSGCERAGGNRSAPSMLILGCRHFALGHLRVGPQIRNHGRDLEGHLLAGVNERGHLPGCKGNRSIPGIDLDT